MNVRSLKAILLLSAMLITAAPVRAEVALPVVPSTTPASNVAGSITVPELAREMGIVPLLSRLEVLRNNPNKTTADRLEELQLRQELTDQVMMALLAVRSAGSQVSTEIMQSNQLATYLAAKRDRKLLVSSVSNFVAEGVSESLGGAFQIVPVLDKTGNTVEIVGGGVQMLLSSLAIQQQKGSRKFLDTNPNMLAKIFDLPTDAESDYPPLVWTFLNAVPGDSTVKVSRRAYLIQKWTEVRRVPAKNVAGYKRTIVQVAGCEPQHQTVTIDVLSNRAAMLADVGTFIAQVDKQLFEIMQLIVGTARTTSGGGH